MKVGVFDSGVGGRSVANAILKALPDFDVIVREDKQNIPYGTKTPETLFSLVLPILLQMESEGCEAIVIACNTVTTNIIEQLRKNISVPLIGMEPMIKPAADQTKHGVVGLFATPRTLSSDRYSWLKREYAKSIKVIEPDCAEWAGMIQSNTVNSKKIQKTVELTLSEGADVLVLGCTHYHWIENLIRDLAGERATVLQPEQPVIARLREILATTRG